MTNREYLMTLSNYDLARIIIEILPTVWRGYSSSVLGLAQWLGEEWLGEENGKIY